VEAGCEKLIVHARKAWLNGLSPKQNRTIPPVQYDYVYRFKEEHSQIPVVINGNINTIPEVLEHLKYVDGVMVGRLACDNPYEILRIHHALSLGTDLPRRSDILATYLKYVSEEILNNQSLSLLLKPIFNLAHGMAGSKAWKKKITEIIQNKETTRITELRDDLIEMEHGIFS
jgi:tRNA-dihydrouridine synthase A